jgi:hypothetical protein
VNMHCLQQYKKPLEPITDMYSMLFHGTPCCHLYHQDFYKT